MTESTNLYDALKAEIDRVQEIRDIYATIPAGTWARMEMEKDLKAARDAMAEMDVVKMIAHYQSLKEYEL